MRKGGGRGGSHEEQYSFRPEIKLRYLQPHKERRPYEGHKEFVTLRNAEWKEYFFHEN